MQLIIKKIIYCPPGSITPELRRLRQEDCGKRKASLG